MEVETLTDVLVHHGRVHGDRPHVRFYDGAVETEQLTYGALLERASSVGAGLQERGIEPGETVAIMLPTGPAYFYAVYGVLLAGGVPVPMYPPARLSGIVDHLRRHQAILDNSGTSILITVPEAKPFVRLLQSRVDTLQRVVTIVDLARDAGQAEIPPAASTDTALLQYTSGSTGNPKGVVLSHANLLANVRTIGRALELTDQDVAVSWLPLYHDMGLIGACFCSLYYRMPLALMSPLDFIRRPQLWLRAIDEHGGTVSAAPNFAYEYLLRKLRDAELDGLNLSSWRIACNGAEAVSPDTVRRFCERFKAHGFREESMMPVFGLAECSVALAFPRLGQKPAVDRVERSRFTKRGEAVRAHADDTTALEFVACGEALPGHDIRIVNDEGHELPERHVGHLQFRGPSATSGYHRNPEATAELIRGGWLAAGDKAYIADSALYVTGRTKDVIIRAGRNIYPAELEEVVGNLPGIRKGGVVVFGHRDPEAKIEKLVVAAETVVRTREGLEKMRREIAVLASELVGLRADDVLLVRPRTLLKTSSGKIRRAANRELYERGELGKKQNSWWELAKLGVESVPPEMKRVGKAVVGKLGRSRREKTT